MKKLSEYWKVVDDYSGRASALARQAAFAGIGVVWVFAISDPESGKQIGSSTIVPLLMFTTSLVTELLQYLYGTVAWFFFCRLHERRLKDVAKEDPVLSAPVWINLPTSVLFGLKKEGRLHELPANFMDASWAVP